MNAQQMSNRELLALLVGQSLAKSLAGKSLAELFGFAAPRPAPLIAETQAKNVVHPAIEAARELYVRAISETMEMRDCLTSPQAVRECLIGRMRGLEHEVFACLWLDSRHHLLAYEQLFRGTLMQTSVYPREVVKRALALNAAGVIFAHNHPSGLAQPSQADELLTRNLKEALALVDVKVLDHFIVAGTQAISFAECGRL